MVLQKAQNAVSNLKDRPKDERKVVAGGIAIAVIAVLFFGWVILFLKKIQTGGQQLEFSSGAQDEFLSDAVRQAQIDLQNSFSNIDELNEIRAQAVSRQLQSEGTVQLSNPESGANPFGGEDN